MQGIKCRLEAKTYCRDYPVSCATCSNNTAESRFTQTPTWHIQSKESKDAGKALFEKPRIQNRDSEIAFDILTDSVENYRRSTPLRDIKPLMLIKSVRRIPQVLEAFERLNFIDKVYFRNYPPKEICDIENTWLKEHLKDYTHIIISSDDITPTPRQIKQLLEDVKEYDLPVVAGFCNVCEFNRKDEQGMMCGYCADNMPHPSSNVTFLPVSFRPLTRESYSLLSMQWTEQHPRIYRVWFQGMACAAIRRDVCEQIPFRSWTKGLGGLMEDLAFAEDCAEHGIPQFVDFRVSIRHFGTHHGQILVGKERKGIDFEKASRT